MGLQLNSVDEALTTRLEARAKTSAAPPESRYRAALVHTHVAG